MARALVRWVVASDGSRFLGFAAGRVRKAVLAESAETVERAVETAGSELRLC